MTPENEAAMRTPDHIQLGGTERSPKVDFDFAGRALSISGESYPEDAAAFFGPLIQALRSHLAQPGPALRLDMEMAYFNSSSAKALMNLFQVLERGAEAGTPVIINWHYAPDDEAMQEFGEDFAGDFQHAQFNLCAKP